MTAFLNIGVPRAPACPRDALRRVDASRSIEWLIRPFGRPIRRWRSGNKAPEFPPG